MHSQVPTLKLPLKICYHYRKKLTWPKQKPGTLSDNASNKNDEHEVLLHTVEIHSQQVLDTQILIMIRNSNRSSKTTWRYMPQRKISLLTVRRKPHAAEGKHPIKVKTWTIFHGMAFTPLNLHSSHDISFADLEKAKLDNEQADKLLKEKEMQAKILQETLQAEEKKCKALKLQQQITRTERKVQQEKNRYLKEQQKNQKSRESETIAPRLRTGNQTAKKELDSWLKTQRNLTSSRLLSDSDSSEIESVKSKIPQIQKTASIYSIAKDLINDEKLSVCRDMGIMKKRDNSSDSQRSTGRDRERRRDKSPNLHHGRERGSGCKQRRSMHYADRSPSHSRSSHSTRCDRSPRQSPARRGCASWYDRQEPWAREMQRAFSPSRHKQRASESDRSWFSDTDTTSDESPKCTNRSKCHRKSGINVKPCSKVKTELTYPHFSLGQLSGFMSAPILYYTLNYEQFMAGELCTIMNCTSSNERRGRVTLLQKISNWKLMTNAS